MAAQLERDLTKKQAIPHVTDSVTFASLLLQSGERFGPITLTYETWGTLNEGGDNAILITHALTGSAHAHDVENSDNPKAGWWNLLIGPERPFDTEHHFVICSNILGSCYGSTGPSSIDPHIGKPYGMHFPVITIRDMVRAQYVLLEHLGVRGLAMVAGGSIGGLQALEWAVTYPDMVQKVVVVAATVVPTAQAIAFGEVQRQVIMLDPAWCGGNYTLGHGPNSGLAIARMQAMITYQSEEIMESRFAHNVNQRDPIPAPTYSTDLGKRFDVENYLYYHGHLLASRFDANSYLYLSRAMDLYDVSQGYFSVEDALRRIHCKALFIGIRSDFLFPAKCVRWLAEKVHCLGGDASYVELDSPHGHDAFLKEWKQMVDALNLLKKNS